jgi:predicted metal-binding membrane protein
MPMMPPAISALPPALMSAAMMVAMMLPSIAPALWRYHHHLRAMHLSRAVRRTSFLAAGYACVRAMIGVAMFALSAKLPPMPTSLSPAIVLCAGLVQRSRWKAKRLLRCRRACMPAGLASTNALTVWRDGCRLGADCALSCAAPMAVLLAAGLMDTRAMLVITAVITAERVAPGGARIARLTGGLALIAGSVMCARSIEAALYRHGPLPPTTALSYNAFSSRYVNSSWS